MGDDGMKEIHNVVVESGKKEPSLSQINSVYEEYVVESRFEKNILKVWRVDGGWERQYNTRIFDYLKIFRIFIFLIFFSKSKKNTYILTMYVVSKKTNYNT